jgi:hypothetical protein
LDVLQSGRHDLVIPALVAGEVAYLLERRLGAYAEAAFIRGLDRFRVEPPVAEDWARIAALIDQYANFPLGTVDASIVALAERLDVEHIITLDRRHFSAVRPRHRDHFTLLP